MPDADSPGRLDRRSFLKAVGGAASVLLAPALLRSSAAPPAPAPASPLNIGLLLPTATRYPQLGANLLAGMQLALERPGARPVRLLVEDYGVSPGTALAQTRALIEQAHVDLVLSTVSASTAALIASLLLERQVPLVAAGAGANIPRRNRESPFIVRSSLSYWQSSYALGTWAARSLGRRAFIATSFYDSGYDANYAFRLGFERAGGQIANMQVSHRPIDTAGLAPMVAAIAAARPDVVYAAYCGHEAVEFVRAYAAAGLSVRIPLIGSGFLADEHILPEQGEAALGIRTALPWVPGLDTAPHRAFAQAFAARTGRPADAFAALGFDTARLLSVGLADPGVNPHDPERLLQALGAASFDGPRGHVMVDIAARSATSPIYLREVRRGPQGLRNVALAELPHPTEDGRLAAVRTSALSGWQNAYLSI